MRKICLLALLLSPAISHAYVGPGIGLGVIATLMALGSAFFVMLFHFVVAPLRKLFGKDKHADEDTGPKEDRETPRDKQDQEDGSKEN